MGRSGTAGRGSNERVRRWAHRFSWVLGAFLVCLGAVSGAFGTIAWLTALCAPSLARMVLGMVSLGLLPVVGGGALLWAGLGILEAHAHRSRVHRLPEAHIADAARGGATARAIADKLGVTDLPEMTHRLDDLVSREILSLDIDEDGELLYRKAPSP